MARQAPIDLMCPHFEHDRSDRILEGQIVLRCKACKMLSVEGAGKWIKGGLDWKDRLKAAAGLTEMANDRDLMAKRDHEAKTSSIDDPRWERIQ